MVLSGPWDRQRYYILLPDHAVRAVPLLEWAVWFEEADRRVVETTIGPYWVSTVFLGADHGFMGRVLLFETMVFDKSGGEKRAALDVFADRYATWDEAIAGHANAVAMVLAHAANRKQA